MLWLKFVVGTVYIKITCTFFSSGEVIKNLQKAYRKHSCYQLFEKKKKKTFSFEVKFK